MTLLAAHSCIIIAFINPTEITPMATLPQSPAEIATLRQQFAALERPARPRSTRALILHELMPDIENKLNSGWRYADVVAGLDELGIAISPNTLRNYVARARQNRGKSATSTRLPKTTTTTPKQVPVRAATTVTATPQASTTQAPAARPQRRTHKKVKPFAGFDEAP